MSLKRTFLAVIHMMALARSYGVSVLVLSIVVIVLTVVKTAGAQGEEGTFTHEWAVQISGGDEEAKAIAAEQDFDIVTKIFHDTYLFRHKRLAKRSLSPHPENHEALTAHPNVIWAEQQEVKRRVKRDFFEDSDGIPREKRSSTSTFMNDPKWPQMWYMNRGGNRDMDVEKAWAEGVTGKGVVVTILDDGLEKDHPDIIKNYDPNASYDVNSQDYDPMPRYDLLNSNRHGTRCAGEVAADANNSICALGAAFEASIGGVRMLDGDVTDAVEARSLALNPQHIDIYSASWGPDDDGKTVDGPGQLASRAFVEGVTNGRKGKGSIFVWASGNGGRDQDNCNCDGYTNSIWTLSISSATEKGEVPWYSEACSSTLATTYSSGSFGEKQIVTTDLHHSCTVSHTGTSASAPLAAGICALALQVNNKLTWRDMQHIVVRTARPENLKASDWQTNGVGRRVSHRFGYGLMDAYGMVLLARNWTTVPLQRKCEVSAPHVGKLIPEKSVVTLNLEVSSCPGVNYLEHVQAKVTMMADRRGDLEIYLTSPAGTRSTLLAMRPRDISHTGFHSWPFMTVHMWGENPVGNWKLEIHNNGHFFSTGEAEFKEWGLNLYGTETKPGEPSQSLVTPSSQESMVTQDVPLVSPVDTPKGTTEEREPVPHTTSSESAAPPTPSPIPIKLDAIQGCQKADKLACLVCASDLYLFDGKCISTCPEGYYGWHPEHSKTKPETSKCLKCHYTCKECLGPQDYECKTCWGDSEVYNEAADQSFCRPSSLLKLYENQQKWNTLLLLLLLFLFALTLLLAVLVIRASRGGSQAESSGYSSLNKNQRNGRPHYKNITAQDQLITKIPFHDTSSDEEI